MIATESGNRASGGIARSSVPRRSMSTRRPRARVRFRLVSDPPTTRRPAPQLPDKLKLVRPRVGAVLRDDAETALKSLISGQAWVGDGAYAKFEQDDFTYLGQLRIGDEACNVALKQMVARPGLWGALRARSPRRRARRQYRGAEQVLALGIPTGNPILLATGRLHGRRCDWLLMRRVPGKDVLRHLADERNLSTHTLRAYRGETLDGDAFFHGNDALVIGLGLGSVTPTVQAATVNLVQPHNIGLAVATFYLLLDLGTGIGPLLLGAVVGAWDYRVMYLVSAALVVVIAVHYTLVHGRHAGRARR